MSCGWSIVFVESFPLKGPKTDPCKQIRPPAAENPGGGGAGNAAATSAPTSPQIDGKAFFRAARGKLSYENFNAFLANIKRLNNHQQSREETLEEARLQLSVV